jgi:hypothetical protein
MGHGSPVDDDIRPLVAAAASQETLDVLEDRRVVVGTEFSHEDGQMVLDHPGDRSASLRGVAPGRLLHLLIDAQRQLRHLRMIPGHGCVPGSAGTSTTGRATMKTSRHQPGRATR